MRASFLPLLVAALAFVSPIAAQDPSATDPGMANPSPTDDTGADPSSDMGASASATDDGASPSDDGASATDGPSASATDGAPAPSGSATDDTGSGNPGISPSEPSDSTVVNINQQITASWTVNPDGDQWTNMTIQLTTGSNYNMVQLSVVGSGINAMQTTQYSFTAPEVHPTSKIYFLTFTNPPFDPLWTTRFTIAGLDGSTTPPQFNQTDQNGDVQYESDGTTPIMWGNGALGPATQNGTPLPAPTAPAQKGVGPNGITIYKQGINTGTEIPPGVTLTGVAAATLGAAGPGQGANAAPNAAARAAATPVALIGAVVAAAAFLA